MRFNCFRVAETNGFSYTRDTAFLRRFWEQKGAFIACAGKDSNRCSCARALQGLELARKNKEEMNIHHTEVSVVRLARFILPTSLILSLLVLVLVAAPAQADARYQIQIGSAKQWDGTRYFTRKASTVLATTVYILKLGEYYTVLVGDYGTREQAVNELLRIKKHYNGMVVSYSDFEVIGAFENGQEVNAEAAASLTGPAVKAPSRKLPVRIVEKEELSSLDQTLEGNLDNIIVEGCRLSNEETLSEYLFATTCKFGDLDPDAITIEEKYGNNFYIHVDTLQKRPLIRMKQMKDGVVSYERSDALLVLRSKTKNKKQLSKTVIALHDLILYCAKNN